MSEKAGRPRLSHLLLVLAVVAVASQFVGLYRATGPPSLSWFPNADKLEHVLGFAAPALLVMLAQSRRQAEGGVPPGDLRLGRLNNASVAVVVGAFALQAVVSEVVQHFWYRHRTGDPFDALADLTGIVVGWLVAIWLTSSGASRRHRADRASPPRVAQ